MRSDLRTALDLHNSLDPFAWPRNALRDMRDLRVFLQTHGAAGLLNPTGGDLLAARTLRTDLRAAVRAPDRAEALAPLLAAHPVAVVLDGGGLALEAVAGASWSARLHVAAVGGLALHLARYGPGSLAVCRVEPCGRLFAARSATPRRRCCSDRCAARARQRAHRGTPRPLLTPPMGNRAADPRRSTIAAWTPRPEHPATGPGLP